MKKRVALPLSAGLSLLLVGCTMASPIHDANSLPLPASQGLLSRTSLPLTPNVSVLPSALPLAADTSVPLFPLLLEHDSPPEVAGTTPFSHSVERIRLTGFARVNPGLENLANVSEGRVIGTPVRVRDARTGRHLFETVTFYDGSFSIEMPIGVPGLPVVVSTELVNAGDSKITLSLSAPSYLSQGIRQQEVVLGAGATALTLFLQAVASRASDSGLPFVGLGGEFFAGPRFGALVRGIDEAERESFSRLAESAPEIRDAQTLLSLQEGIQRFVKRISQRVE
ncbi:MAG: hypothetical protein VKN33_04340 [Candidatus Sericytochromatia bacterium]|nr:hypothetical protein [Candidatus Sericytochromatia bacterium]